MSEQPEIPENEPVETVERDVVYELPKANINRIVKNSVPEEFQIGTETKSAFSKASVVFIMYLTAKSNEIAHKAKKSTISADDVLAAIKSLGFEAYEDELLTFLQEFRKSQSAKKSKNKKEKSDSVVDGDTIKDDDKEDPTENEHQIPEENEDETQLEE